jgi:hypothetical protein
MDYLMRIVGLLHYHPGGSPLGQGGVVKAILLSPILALALAGSSNKRIGNTSISVVTESGKRLGFTWDFVSKKFIDSI